MEEEREERELNKREVGEGIDEIISFDTLADVESFSVSG